MAPLPPPPPPAPPVTLPSSHPVPSSKTTDSLLTKSQKFIEENKLLVLGAAVLAVSGAGYYLYTTNAAANKPRARIEKDASSSDEEEVGAASPGGVAGKSEKKKKKKGSKSKSKKKSAAGSSLDKLANSEESPLLEERDAEEVQRILERKRAKEQEAGVSTQGNEGGELKAENLKEKTSAPAQSSSTPAEEPVPSYLEGIPRTKEEIAKLPSNERKTLATTLKTRGNKLYGAKKYKEAVACYTKALEVAEKEEAVFYSNRAACYQNMSPPNYEQVVKDCDSALRLDSGYVKALNRRATAFEALGRDEEALRDFTATTIMEKFQNDAASASVERVLKKIAQKKAEEMLSTREPRLPSKTFVSAYLGAFRPRE
jgi:import receptor subunit TOM70